MPTPACVIDSWAMINDIGQSLFMQTLTKLCDANIESGFQKFFQIQRLSLGQLRHRSRCVVRHIPGQAVVLWQFDCLRQLEGLNLGICLNFCEYPS